MQIIFPYHFKKIKTFKEQHTNQWECDTGNLFVAVGKLSKGNFEIVIRQLLDDGKFYSAVKKAKNHYEINKILITLKEPFYEHKKLHI